MTPKLEAAREKLSVYIGGRDFGKTMGEALALLVSAIEADAQTIAELREALERISCRTDHGDQEPCEICAICDSALAKGKE
jgi:hypothetical protein